VEKTKKTGIGRPLKEIGNICSWACLLIKETTGSQSRTGGTQEMCGILEEIVNNTLYKKKLRRSTFQEKSGESYR